MNLTNKLLVSKQNTLPVGRDSERLVVHVFMHNHRGAVGMQLNGKVVSSLKHIFLKPVFNTPEGHFPTLKEMMVAKELDSLPLYYGGPSKTEGIYFVHGHDDLKDVTGRDWEPTQHPEKPSGNELINGVYFGSPFTFGHIVERGLFGDGRFRFLTGQFKWYATQLETEIEAGYWDVVEPEPDIFFSIEKCEGLIPARDKAFTAVRPSVN